MKGRIFTILAAVMVICGCSCGIHRDGPPDTDLPEPEPLNGVFTGTSGTMTFNGDGKTVVVAFVGDAAAKCPGGQMEYAFTWGSRGLVRYDQATSLTLYADGQTYLYNVEKASPTLLKFDSMVFEKR